MRENDAVFAALSRKGQGYLVEGRLYAYADILKAKAVLLDAEDKHLDMLKVLMLAFYIYTSGDGQSCVFDAETINMATHAKEESRIGGAAFDALYFDTIDVRTTRRHRYGVKRALRLLKRKMKRCQWQFERKA